ncbi:MAG: HlyD family secretion protein, partial [Pseudomonadota bacterium]
AAAASTAHLQAGGAADALQVRAPVAARVLRVQHESEGPVAAGQPLLEIGNPESLEAEVEVLSTDAVKIVSGSRVILDRWGGDPSIEGRVRVVEPGGYTENFGTRRRGAAGARHRRFHFAARGVGTAR